ncbi:MAG: ribonuclease III [Proteobacteria bacterium]|nr:ribonuclease III [Pseudomonadota bacterium]
MSGRQEARFAELEQRLGYVFKDRALFREAMTHGSALDGDKSKRRSYDRLEFLGDRVLALIVADRLLQEHADEAEGEIAPRFNTLVNKRACAVAARAAGLGEAAILSTSEEGHGGRNKDTILADLCEAMIGALYRDAGFEAARAFVERFWGNAFDEVNTSTRDAKTALQEWAAAHKRGLSYALVEQSGPDHAPHFVIEARIDGFTGVRGEGASKRIAQRAAATSFLKAQGVDV